MEELTFVIDIKKSGDSCKKFDGVKKYIATADIIDDEIVGYTEVTYDNKPSRANVVAKPGDVLFAKMQNTIKVIVVDEETCNYIYSTGFYCISDERFLPKFLKCYFMSKTFNDKKDKNCNGATMKALSDEGFKKIKLPLIPKEIQQRIIDEYIALSASIKNKKNQINVFDELIKSQFIEMFGDPTINNMLWSKEKLSTNCTIITGNTPPRAHEDNYGTFIEWIKTDNILENVPYPTKAKEFLSEIGLEIGRSAPEKSILMVCIAGSINSIGRVCILDRKVAFNQQINSIISENYNMKFLLYLLKMSKEFLVSDVNMALKGILSKSMLENKSFIVPPRPLQDQFAAIVEQIDKSKFINKMSLILQF